MLYSQNDKDLNINWGFIVCSALIFLPLFGGILLLMLPESLARNAKPCGLWITGLTMLLSLYAGQDVFSKSSIVFEEERTFLPVLNSFYALGLDGISWSFVFLTALLVLLCLLFLPTQTPKIAGYVSCLLFLESFLMGFFCARDLLIFYLFFEIVLIPLFFIIGIWGGKDRIRAAFKFFLYTFWGSIFMIASLVTLTLKTNSFDLATLSETSLPPSWRPWVWLGFFLAFAIKLPIWPFHTWLPEAHVQAPTTGSVLLAGILLKMGGYGMFRILVPIMHETTLLFRPLLWTLGCVSILYASLVAWGQTDAKKMIAYSSVAHMGYIPLGMGCLTPLSLSGAWVQMISHGLLSAALFFAIGMIYDRLHTRDLASINGLKSVMPQYHNLFFLILLGSIGLPGTSGFVGEFFVLLSVIKINGIVGFVASLGLVLGAVYMFYLYRSLFLGKRESVKKIDDISMGEKSILGILVIGSLLIGLYPRMLLRLSETSFMFISPS